MVGDRSIVPSSAPVRTFPVQDEVKSAGKDGLEPLRSSSPAGYPPGVNWLLVIYYSAKRSKVKPFVSNKPVSRLAPLCTIVVRKTLARRRPSSGAEGAQDCSSSERTLRRRVEE
jgi:hypothetical protein